MTNIELNLLQNMYDKICDIMISGVGDKPSAFSSKNTIFQLAKIGLVVNPKDYINQFSPINPNGNLNSAEFFSKLVDGIPMPQEVYIAKSESIDSTYGNIINFAVPSDMGSSNSNNIRMSSDKPDLSELYTEITLKDINGNDKVYYTHTKEYDEYLNNYYEYQANLLKYLSSIHNGEDNSLLLKKVNESHQKCNSPEMAHIEKILQSNLQPNFGMNKQNNNSNFSSSGIANFLSNERRKFKISEFASSAGPGFEWHLTYAMPSNWCEADANIFTKFQFSIDAKDLNFEFNKMDFNRDCNNVDLVNYFNCKNNYQLNSGTINISFEMSVINIVRPWLNATIFKLSGWKNELFTTSGSISSGKFDDINSIMSLIPTAFVLIKNVLISDSDNKNIISNPNLQIIGFVSEIVPFSPK